MHYRVVSWHGGQVNKKPKESRLRRHLNVVCVFSRKAVRGDWVKCKKVSRRSARLESLSNGRLDGLMQDEWTESRVVTELREGFLYVRRSKGSKNKWLRTADWRSSHLGSRTLSSYVTRKGRRTNDFESQFGVEVEAKSIRQMFTAGIISLCCQPHRPQLTQPDLCHNSPGSNCNRTTKTLEIKRTMIRNDILFRRLLLPIHITHLQGNPKSHTTPLIQ